MREGDRVAILRLVQNVEVGDMIRGVDPTDFGGYSKVEYVRNDGGINYQFRPHLGAIKRRMAGEYVEVYLAPNKGAALRAWAAALWRKP